MFEQTEAGKQKNSREKKKTLEVFSTEFLEKSL
jgi:hypothetical protein